MRDYMSQNEVHTPLQLIGWLRGCERDLRSSGRIADDSVRRDLRGLMKYAYLKDYIQEFVMKKSGMGQTL